MSLEKGWMIKGIVNATHSGLSNLATRTVTGKEVDTAELRGLIDTDPSILDEATTRAFSILGGTIGSPLGLLPMLSTLYASGRGAEHQQIAMRAYLPNRIPPEVYAKLIYRHYITEETEVEWRKDLEFQGWHKDRIDAIVESYRSLYGLNEIRGLFLRGMLGEGDKARAEAIKLINKHGFTDDEASKLIDLFYFIPSPQDLVSWSAREVYEPEMVKEYGLDDEFEGLDLRDFHKAGVSKEQALNFWRAHWQHPSLNTMTELLHRTSLTEDDMYKWYRVVEFPPKWRNLLTEIAYTPFTRVDIRRMYRLGVLDEFGVFKANAEIGYRPYVLEHKHDTHEEAFACEVCKKSSPAGAMLEFIKRYYPIEDDSDDKEVRSLTKTEILRGYREHIIDHEIALTALQAIDYHEDIAHYLIILEDVKSDETETKEELAFITDKYKLGLMTDEDLIARLGALDLSGEQLEYYITKITRYRNYNIRRPTLADFKRWYKLEIINLDIYREELKLEGFIDEHIENFIKEVWQEPTEEVTSE